MMLEEKDGEQIKAMARLVWHRLMAGEDEEEVRDSLDLDSQEFKRLKDRMFSDIGEYVKGRPIEHTYADYMLNQIKVVKQLDKLVNSFLDPAVATEQKGKKPVKAAPIRVTQPTAFVSALKAISDIHDKILKTGKELGLVNSDADGQALEGVNLAELTNQQLRSSIVRELGDLKRLSSAYGSMDITDQETGDLHINAQSSTKKQHARNPVYGGRGKVKIKP